MNSQKSNTTNQKTRRRRETSLLEYMLSPYFAWRLAGS